MRAKTLKWDVLERHTDAIKCDCGGYAGSVRPTSVEESRHGCDRPGCCSRAFVCGLCGQRYLGKAPAPEAE